MAISGADGGADHGADYNAGSGVAVGHQWQPALRIWLTVNPVAGIGEAEDWCF